MDRAFTVELIELWEDGGFAQDSASNFFSRHSEKDVDRFRIKISRAYCRGEQTVARCGLCRAPIYITRKTIPKQGLFSFFAHYSDKQFPHSKNCPQRANKLSIPVDALRAYKYQGAKESALHKHLKACIRDVLIADSSVPNKSVLIEKQLKDADWWRRPDVQADIRGTTVAFEVQVSTEFTAMIVMREWFYESCDSAAILWIMPSFDPKNINSSERDIQISNKDHMFVLTEELIDRSVKEQKLYLECWLHIPELSDNWELTYNWHRRIVGLDDIQFEGGHAQVLNIHEIENKLKDQQQAYKEYQKLVSTVMPSSNGKTSAQPTRLGSLERKFYREWSDLYESIADLPLSWIRSELIERELVGHQSGDILGIWLKSRGIDWTLANCGRVAAKALVSADKQEILWSHQNSWKWVTNQIVQHHISWLRPYNNLMKENSDYQKHRQQHKGLEDALIESRDTPPLDTNQKALLAVLCPRLLLDEPHRIPLIDIEAQGLSYQILYDETPAHRSKVYSPEFLHIEHSGPKSEQTVILRALQHDLEKSILQSLGWTGGFIPMPNLHTKYYPTASYVSIRIECQEEVLTRLLEQCFELRNKRRIFI